MGINLHSVVRATINTVHDDEAVQIYHSAGQINIKGEVSPAYFAPAPFIAQIQSEGGDTLTHNDNYEQAAQRRKFYLRADVTRPAALIRQMARGGDLIKRADGSWWLITSTVEDFSAVGWVCVIAVRQVESDDFEPRLIDIPGEDDNEVGGEQTDDDISETGDTPDNDE